MSDKIDLALHSYSLRLHYLHVPGYDVFSFISDAAALGFTGVNIGLSGPDNDRLPPFRHLSGNSRAHIAKVRDFLAERQMSVEVDSDSTDKARLLEAMEVAQGLGARILRTFTHHPPGPGIFERTLEDLREIAPLAERAGVTIALENHEEFTSGELAAMMSALSGKGVRLLYDYGNGLPVLEEPEEALTAMQDWIVACHMKDGVMVASEDAPDGVATMIGVPLGEGSIDFKDLTRRLLAAGLSRICLQNVWGYHVPLGKLRHVDRDDPRLGQGTFRYKRPPFERASLCFNPEEQLESRSLVALERAAVERAARAARKMLGEIELG